MISTGELGRIRKDLTTEDNGLNVSVIDNLLNDRPGLERSTLEMDRMISLLEQIKYNPFDRCTIKSDKGVKPMEILIPPWGVINLRGPSIESVRRSFFEYKAKGAVLFDLRFDTFDPRGTPEAKARFGVHIVQTASFLRSSCIGSLRPHKYGGMVSENLLPESSRLDLLKMIASQGFSWIEIEEDIPGDTRKEIIDLARRSGTRVMITKVLDGITEWAPPDGLETEDIQGYKVLVTINDSNGLKKAIRTSRGIRAWIPGKMTVIEPFGGSKNLTRILGPISISDMVYIDGTEISGDLSKTDPSGHDIDRWSVWKNLGIIGNDISSDWSLWNREMTPETSIYLQMGRLDNAEFRNRMFNAQFNHLSMDAMMVPIGSDFGDSVKQLDMARSMGMKGIFIEMPLRTSVAGMMDWVDPRSATVGSIDVISFRGGKACGFNSEIYGVGDQIHISDITKGSKALILGTGASGRSAAVASSMMGMDTYIAGSSHDRAKEIANNLKSRIKGTSFKALSKPGTKFDLIINSVPFETRSVKGASDGTMEIAEIVRGLEPSYGMDLYYKLQWTPFLSSIESRGGVPISGVDILMRSSLRAFKLMTGADGHETNMRSIIQDIILK